MPPKPIIAAKLPIRLPTWRPTPSCWASSSANERRNRPWANRSDPLDKPDESLTWDLRSEAEQWARIGSGVPLPLDPEARLDDLVEKGCLALERRDARAACDHWRAAWKIVQQLARLDLRTASAF